MQEELKNQGWIWDRYWQADRVASCFANDASNYPGEFVQEWRRFFDNLPRAARILDLCTGNGAIARIAAEVSEGKNKGFCVIAVDKADIKPDQFVSAPVAERIVAFKGGIAAEELPFTRNEFDAVVSQYGFEYTKTNIVVAKLSEVLKPGGRAKLICHATEGVPAENARVEISKIRRVTDEFLLFDTARAAIDLVWQMEQAPPNQARALAPGAQTARVAFEKALGQLARDVGARPNDPFLANTFGLLKHTFEVRRHFPIETLLEKIDETKAEALAHLGRVEALLDASLSEADCRALSGLLESHGFTNVVFAPFTIEGGTKLVGWNFEFARLAKTP